MNENNNYNDSRVPYKAAANLNTAIGNPSVNINDTMNVNIKTMSTPLAEQVNQSQNNNFVASTPVTTSNIQNIQNQNQTYQMPGIANNVTEQKINNNSQNNTVISNLPNQNTQDSNLVRKRYVNMDNKTKKKTIAFNVGPEFKIAVLIIVILLVFVFLLPIINNIIFGY